MREKEIIKNFRNPLDKRRCNYYNYNRDVTEIVTESFHMPRR